MMSDRLDCRPSAKRQVAEAGDRPDRFMKKNSKTPVRIEELSPEDRPYEKCLKYGVSALTDRELLAVIIRSGIRGCSSLELAGQVLLTASERTGSGLCGMIRLSLAELMRLEGIGKVRAIQIQCIGELSRRIAASQARSHLSFNDPATIADYYMETLRHEDQEIVMIMMLDTKMHRIAETMVSKGTVNASVVSPREIMIEALRMHAVNVILIHNHPSGDPEPSEPDLLLTSQVSEAGAIVGIRLLDHIIIGDQCYVSLKEEGLLSDAV